MKQSVMQYLTQHKLVTVQVFTNFMVAIQEVLSKEHEYFSPNLSFEMFRKQVSDDEWPKHIPRETFIYVNRFTFGDAGGQYVIYETYEPQWDKVTPTAKYYVEQDPEND